MVKHIKTGNRVEIGFRVGGNERRRLSTLVEAVLKSRDILVLIPMSAGTIVRLPEGAPMEARFYTGNSVMVFDVTIVEHPTVNDIQLTKLKLESEGKRIQLRDFFRISSAISFHFSLMANDAGEGGKEIHSAVTKDLSGGGICFLTNLAMEEDTKIFANFSLGGEYIVTPGRVFGKQDASGGNYKYMYRCQFVSIAGSDQEKIVQFVQSLQLKTLQNN